MKNTIKLDEVNFKTSFTRKQPHSINIENHRRYQTCNLDDMLQQQKSLILVKNGKGDDGPLHRRKRFSEGDALIYKDQGNQMRAKCRGCDYKVKPQSSLSYKRNYPQQKQQIQYIAKAQSQISMKQKQIKNFHHFQSTIKEQRADLQHEDHYKHVQKVNKIFPCLYLKDRQSFRPTEQKTKFNQYMRIYKSKFIQQKTEVSLNLNRRKISRSLPLINKQSVSYEFKFKSNIDHEKSQIPYQDIKKALKIDLKLQVSQKQSSKKNYIKIPKRKIKVNNVKYHRATKSSIQQQTFSCILKSDRASLISRRQQTCRTEGISNFITLNNYPQTLNNL